MSNATEVKRGRGRPKAFPDVETIMAGFNLPTATLEKLRAGVESRNAKRAAGTPSVTQNTLVNRALLAYLRRD